MKRKLFIISTVCLSSALLFGCSSNNKYSVSKKNDTTYISIPDNFTPSDTLPKELKDAGFIDCKKESNGSVSYTISTDDYKAYLKQQKDSINSYIKEINESGEHEAISEIKLNKDMNTLKIKIFPDKYEKSDDDLITNALALKILNYRAYSGKKISVKIKLIDTETDSVYDTLTIEK